MRPRNRWLFGLWILAATALRIPVLCADDASPHAERCVKYQVWGGSLHRPHDDRPWSDVCCDGQVARQRLREILADYAEHGLLAAASDKPTGLRVLALESRAPPLPVHPLTAAIDRPQRPGAIPANHSAGQQELPVNPSARVRKVAAIHPAHRAILLAGTLHRMARNVRLHQAALIRALSCASRVRFAASGA